MIRQTTRSKRRMRARDIVGLELGYRAPSVLRILVWTNPYVHARERVTKSLRRKPSIFERRPSSFEQQPVLRIHGLRLTWADAEQRSIKASHVVEQRRVAHVALARGILL